MNDDTFRIPSPTSVLRDAQANTAMLGSLARSLIGVVKAIYLLLLHALSFGPELFLRRCFGERFLSPWMLFVAMLMPLLWISESQFLVLIWIGMLPVLFLIHFTHRQILRRKGEVWHSYSCGVNHRWLNLFKTDWLNRLLSLPAFVGVVGISISLLGASVGAYLLLCGIAMMLKGLSEYEAFRTLVLDTIDAQIESRHLAEAVSGITNATATQGFTVPGAGKFTDEELSALGMSVEFVAEPAQQADEPASN